MRRGLRTIVYDDTIPEEQSYESVMPSQAPAMDNVMPTTPGMEDPRLRQIALADGGVVEREGFGKGSPPPGYITGKQLEQLTGIPNLSIKAKELMYAPKKYKRQKNIFGDFYRKELKAKYFDIGQGGKYGTLHYKTPTAEQIEKMKEYHLRKGAKYGVTQATADRMKLFHNNPKLRNYVRNGKIIPDELLKDYDITRNEAAQTTFRLAQAYNGKKFINVDVRIPENKKAGKKLFETIDKSPFGNPYKMVAYKEALNVITEGIGDKYFEKTNFENMKREARRILQKEKISIFDPTIKGSTGININELTGVTASSRNKSYPYSQFINLMEGNLNTRAYARFNKEFEKYEKDLQNEIAKGSKGDPNKIIKKYKNYTKNFLGGLEDVDRAQIEKLGLPELSLKEPTELYGKRRISQLTKQGLDLPGSYKELGYSIQVPKGTATLKEFINNPEIRNQMIAKEFPKETKKLEKLITNIGCPTGALKASTGANCYVKGMEKIQSGNLNKNEFNILQKAVKSPAAVNAIKYGGVALKGLGAILTPLMFYDTYDKYKEGKPFSEALEYGLLGTNIIGSIRDESKFTPQEREARGATQQYEREQDDISGLSSDFYVPSNLSAYEAAKITEDARKRIAAERAAEEKQRAAEIDYQGDPGIQDDSGLYAYGGRVGLKDAGDPKDKPILPINPMIGGEDPRGPLQDPGRRDVLKGMGLVGAGAAAAKLGLLGLGKTAKVAKVAPLTEVVAPVGETLTQFPTWFPNLIKRARNEGKQIPIFKQVEVPLTKEEFTKLRKEGAENLIDYYTGRTDEYIDFLKKKGVPPYAQYKNTDEIIGYKYEIESMPQVQVKEYEGKEIMVEFPNGYGRPSTFYYKKPGFSVDMKGKKVKYDAEFKAYDSVPEPISHPEDVPDFFEEIVPNTDEILGGASELEQFALKTKKPRITEGDEVLSRAEARANDYDLDYDYD